MLGKGDDKDDLHQLGWLKGADEGDGEPGGIIRAGYLQSQRSIGQKYQHKSPRRVNRPETADGIIVDFGEDNSGNQPCQGSESLHEKGSRTGGIGMHRRIHQHHAIDGGQYAQQQQRPVGEAKILEHRVFDFTKKAQPAPPVRPFRPFRPPG